MTFNVLHGFLSHIIEFLQAVILPVFYVNFQTRSVTLLEQIFLLSDNSLLRRIFGSKGQYVIKDMRNLNN
jgi:hypothetical protein